MIYYKGFDKDLKCRDFQYEIGKEYETDAAELCKTGFHACEAPLDTFGYYSPCDSRYCEVSLDNVSSERSNDDTKVVAKKIKIGAELNLFGLAKAHVEWVKSHIDNEKEETNTGFQSAATNTGDYSAATNTGNRSAATNTGDYSAATNTGDYSAATNTGFQSAATNTGFQSAAEVSGKDSVAIAVGLQSKARASLGCAIVVAERGPWNGETYPLLSICSAIVDGTEIKADTWYAAKGGKLVEVMAD